MLLAVCIPIFFVALFGVGFYQRIYTKKLKWKNKKNDGEVVALKRYGE